MARRRAVTERAAIVLPERPIESLDAYVEAGGGEAIRLALQGSPDAVIQEISKSGLRGRGGAGFPTGAKWKSVRSDPCPSKYAACNAAEGEPGTFKDRWILRHNPYEVFEGLAIAAWAAGAERAFVALKAGFEPEIAALERALTEMAAARVLGEIPIELVSGPDEYLFGEEKAMVEVIEGNDPLPRILPPYQQGLYASPGSPNPTVVNNVETLANVPHILRRGAEWFRSFGTEGSPGTMVFTLSGDVQVPGLYELPLGVSLRTLVDEVGGGPPDGRDVKAVIPGASAAVLPADLLDTPLDFDSMKAAGSGLGSAGFVVYDEEACIVAAVAAFSRFLYIESCAQCPACKEGSEDITIALERIDRGEGDELDLGTALERCSTVTDGQRCALPTGEALLTASAIRAFEAEFRAHLGRPCSPSRHRPFPKFLDYDAEAARFTYDARYRLKRPDWTYEEP
jgi:NADH:ubiquinone oxidoreductase subunit F (NADH-binding)